MCRSLCITDVIAVPVNVRRNAISLPSVLPDGDRPGQASGGRVRGEAGGAQPIRRGEGGYPLGTYVPISQEKNKGVHPHFFTSLPRQ